MAIPVKVVLDDLMLGELRLSYFDHKGAPEDPHHNRLEQLYSYINRAVDELYVRFPLEEQELLIETELGVDIYTLPIDNVVKITGIYLSDGSQLPINDVNSADSVFLPVYNQLQVPNCTGEPLHVLYRALPKPLKVDKFGNVPEDTMISLPRTMLPALLLYVEYLAHRSMGNAESTNKAMLALQQYEAACMGVERNNLLNTGINTTCIKSIIRGFV